MEPLSTSNIRTYLEALPSRNRRLDGRYDRFSDRFEGRSWDGDAGAAETRYERADRCAERPGSVRSRSYPDLDRQQKAVRT